MNNRLQEMLDHYEITRTLAEYCSACDRCDRDRMRDVYARDSWDNHGHIEASGQAFVDLVMADIEATTTSLYHQLGQSLVKVEGDAAGAETYFFAAAETEDDAGGKTCSLLGGRFIDRLVREEDRWLIQNRTVVRDWTIVLPLDTPWASATALLPGSRSNDDPSFAALGIVHSAVQGRTG